MEDASARSFLDGATAPETRPAHRPTTFDPEKAARICEAIAGGLSLREVAKLPEFPGRATLFRWLEQYPDFARQYALAKEWRIETMADDIIDIADAREIGEDGTLDRSVLCASRALDSDTRAHIADRIAQRKWRLQMEMPRKYGLPEQTAPQLSSPSEQVFGPGSHAGDHAKEVNPSQPHPLEEQIDAWRKASMAAVSPRAGGNE
jgi:hypothetical protein